MRLVALLLAAIFSMTSIPAQAWEIKRPQRAGPVMLACFNPNGLIDHVSRLTRQQIIFINNTASVGHVRAPCDDVQLPVGTRDTGHARWLRTRDGWWILGRTVMYPNNIRMVIADPGVASYKYKPPEFRLRYLFRGGNIYERVN